VEPITLAGLSLLLNYSLLIAESEEELPNNTK